MALPGVGTPSRDTIVSTVVQAGTIPTLQFSLVDLSALPNPGASPTEPNLDPDGELLATSVAKILADHKGCFQRCVVALDAPLEARIRVDQPKRVKAVDAGIATGAKRRQCEEMIQRYKETARGNRLKRGTPICTSSLARPSLLASPPWWEKLKSKCGLVCWGLDRNSHERQVIEIFPSEAIWSLGLMNGFLNLSPDNIRSYKKKKPGSLSHATAIETALRPLFGLFDVSSDEFHCRCGFGVAKLLITQVRLLEIREAANSTKRERI